jgi:voltage-dependent potassium channel beta subunit
VEYNHLGKSGLKISQLSFGSWLTFGGKLDENKAKECINYAYEQGVNFFDNAEVYANGLSESIMGKVIKGYRRESLVVSTKIFWSGKGPNDVGLSRKHLFEATKNSLKRLDLEYVDLLYCHRPDPNTPIVETVRAMSDLVQQGYAFYWGTSEWSAAHVMEAYQLAEQLNCIPPSVEQPEYNLFKRERVEQEYLELYKRYGIGLTTWAPLAFGILSGKYSNGIPPNSRLAQESEWKHPDFPQRVEKTKRLMLLAEDLDCTVGQLAIAWCLKNPHVSSVILGASNVEQLAENLNSLAFVDKLTPDFMKKIEMITQNE